MTKESFIRLVILSGVIIFYFIFTIRFFYVFRKNIIFTGKVKLIHLIMIWLIPFLWILILKSLIKSSPGSYEVENKNDPEPFSNSDGDVFKAANM